MRDFYEFTDVKKARKRHQCGHCQVMIEIGEPYKRGSGVVDGDFSSSAQHHECLEAATAIYKLHDMQPWNYVWLWDLDDLKWDAPWLWENHPIAAERLAKNYPNDMPKELP